MRIGLVIDASCDLPNAYIEEHGIVVLPGIVELGDKEFLDNRDPRASLSVYRRYLADRSLPAGTRPAEVEQIRDLFLEDLVLRYDRVLVLCASASRGQTYSHATQASYSILQGYRDRRAAAGLTESFALRVLDSQSIGAGEAVLACEAVAMMQTAPPPFEKLRREIKDLSRRSVCYLVANDLYFLRHRARDRGEGAMGLGGYLLGRATGLRPVLELRAGETRVAGRARGFQRAVAETMERCGQALRGGRCRPAVCMSFGGDPRLIRELAAYQELEALVAAHKAELHLSVMSATLAVSLGPGAFSLSWIED